MNAWPDREQSAARRAAAIVETVERAASDIIDGAEEEARNHLEGSRRRAENEAAERLRDAGDLADGLVERAERLRGELDGLIDALGSARVRLEEVLAAEPTQPGDFPEPEPAPPEFEPDAPVAPFPPGLRPVPETPDSFEGFESDADPDPEPQGSISLAGARLLVTQMAMAGNGRAEAAAHLEEELPGEQVSRILDAVFGPED